MRICALVIACALLAACGKKGPPLLPYVRVPVAAEIASARRIGNDVYVTVAVPAADIDEATPSAVREIGIYAVTAAVAPPASQFLTIATKVVTIPVARYADPSDTSGTVVPDPETGALQGTSVTIRESLTQAEMVPRELPAPKTGRAALAPPADVRVAEPRPDTLRRFYMTIPLGDRPDRPGPPSKIVDVPMTNVPDRVLGVRIAQKGRSVVLEWTPSGGLLGWLLDRTLPAERPPLDQPKAATAPAAPAGPVRYNVYREIAADPLVLPRAVPDTTWTSVPQTPVNAQPLATLSFTEEVPFDERRRCYEVRAVRGTDAQRVESEASARECLIPIDTEPPVAVTGLTATPVEGSITLRWEPNGEEDLRGYLVLRSDAGDDTLLLLTKGPIAGTRWIDDTVISGRMYRYVVQAVDSRIPAPNVSEPTETTATAP
jgi:hypothetical protein